MKAEMPPSKNPENDNHAHFVEVYQDWVDNLKEHLKKIKDSNGVQE